MKDSEAAKALAAYLTPSQARLLAAHWDKLPDADRAALLVYRWAETNGLPPRDLPFLHLLYLSGSSEALFLALMRHPTQFTGLSNQVNDTAGLGREGMDERLARLFLSRSSDDPAAVLSAFRSLQTARILLQDILGILPFEDVTRELSCLADILIGRSFALTHQALRETMGLPMWVTQEGRAVECTLSVFALGKLGGMELNYSSDVDLVCFYRSEGETDMGRPNHAFFNAWVQAAASPAHEAHAGRSLPEGGHDAQAEGAGWRAHTVLRCGPVLLSRMVGPLGAAGLDQGEILRLRQGIGRPLSQTDAGRDLPTLLLERDSAAGPRVEGKDAARAGQGGQEPTQEKRERRRRRDKGRRVYGPGPPDDPRAEGPMGS